MIAEGPSGEEGAEEENSDFPAFDEAMLPSAEELEARQAQLGQENSVQAAFSPDQEAQTTMI